MRRPYVSPGCITPTSTHAFPRGLPLRRSAQPKGSSGPPGSGHSALAGPRWTCEGRAQASGQKDCGPPSPSARGSARVSEGESWSCIWADESFNVRRMNHTLFSGFVTHLNSQQEQGG